MVLTTIAYGVLANALYDGLKKNLGALADTLRSPWAPTVVFGALAILWLAYWVVLPGWRQRHEQQPRDEAGAGARPDHVRHTLFGVGRDWVRCSCGWTGSGPDFKLHQTGDVVPSTNVPVDAPRAVDRDELSALIDKAKERLAEERGLDKMATNADARSQALRLWLDQWDIDVDNALTGDDATLTSFRRPVDTSQMHYIESPLHVLRTKLQRLRPYTSARQIVAADVFEHMDQKDESPRPAPKPAVPPEELAVEGRDPTAIRDEDLAEHRREREGLLHDARRLSGSLRAMARLKGIADTSEDEQASLADRVSELKRRRDAYRGRWHTGRLRILEDAAFLAADPVPAQGPSWLRRLIGETEFIVWQLESERSILDRHALTE